MSRVGECENLELKEVSGTRHTYLQVTRMSRKLKVMEVDTFREGVETKTQRRPVTCQGHTGDEQQIPVLVLAEFTL